jgi:gamma-glutamyltranspeptidase/glutathione hydrolase
MRPLLLVRSADSGVRACTANIATRNTAAALNVTEPSCTGIGGDLFCLFWDAKAKKVRAINASGRAPAALSLEHLRSQGINGRTIPLTNLNSVTVPGAASGWVKTVEEFGSGKLSLSEILAPAIRLAEEGVPTAELHANAWQGSENLIKRASPHAHDMLLNGKAPLASHIVKFPYLANTFKAVAEHGTKGFYTGRIAEAIVELVQSGGGVMTMEDLASHTANVVEPIKYEFKQGQAGEAGVTLYEVGSYTFETI